MKATEFAPLRRSMLVAAVVLAVVSANVLAASGEWKQLGPEGGEILTIAVSPHSGDVVYAGTSSGVFKSDDGGQTWEFRGLAGERVLAVAVDPATATRVFAGTETMRPGTGGVFVSSDGGATWSEARSGLEDPTYPETSPHFRYLSVTSLLIDQQNPNIVWAGTGENDGLFKSTDGGATWSWARFDDDIEALAADPGGAGIFFASLHGWGPYRSVDSGGTWFPVGTDMVRHTPSGLSYYPTVYDIVISPADPEVVFAVTHREVFKSVDGGDHWESLGELPSSNGGAAISVAVAAHPDDPLTAYVTTEFDGVFQTRDGGASWEQIGELLDCYGGGEEVVHRRATTLAIVPSSSRLLLGTVNEGVFVRPLEGEQWVRANSGLHATNVTSMAVNPWNPRELLAAARGLGVMKSIAGGKSWGPAFTGYGGECGPPRPMPSWAPVPDCRIHNEIVWAGDGSAVFAAGECGVFTSHDRGRSWNLWRSPGKWVEALAIAPRDSRRMYVSRDRWIAYHSVAHSRDAGVTWSSCGELPFEHGVVYSLAVSPEDSSVILAGTGRGLFMSRDGCATWDGPAFEINAECPDGKWTSVRALGFAPDRQGSVYAGTACGLFVSANRGEGWSRAGLAGLDVNALAFGRGEIVAGTWGDGVWAGDHPGVNWVQVSEDNHNPYINDLLAGPMMQRLYSSSPGNGISVLDRWLPEPRRPARRAPTAKSDGKSLKARE